MGSHLHTTLPPARARRSASTCRTARPHLHVSILKIQRDMNIKTSTSSRLQLPLPAEGHAHYCYSYFHYVKLCPPCLPLLPSGFSPVGLSVHCLPTLTIKLCVPCWSALFTGPGTTPGLCHARPLRPLAGPSLFSPRSWALFHLG